jgi:hypothetical protein
MSSALFLRLKRIWIAQKRWEKHYEDDKLFTFLLMKDWKV